MTLSITVDKNTLAKAPSKTKISASRKIIQQCISEFDIANIAVAITGGKDSTLSLWLVKGVCKTLKLPLPKCMFIDEGDAFDEIYEFVNNLQQSWRLDVVWMSNRDVTEKAQFLGDGIMVSSLNQRNREELEKIGFSRESFLFEPESYEGNHLLKTVPMKAFIEDNQIQALITAIRWDEQEARRSEQYFSIRENPPHTRVHPILHFSERDVWQAIHRHNIPFCKLYREGFRSLGTKSSTVKMSEIPAWEQDLENTPERGGRAHEKEKIMDKLRDLGYM
jgi:phosphoadenosine phosphosulfate reductase